MPTSAARAHDHLPNGVRLIPRVTVPRRSLPVDPVSAIDLDAAQHRVDPQPQQWRTGRGACSAMVRLPRRLCPSTSTEMPRGIHTFTLPTTFARAGSLQTGHLGLPEIQLDAADPAPISVSRSSRHRPLRLTDPTGVMWTRGATAARRGGHRTVCGGLSTEDRQPALKITPGTGSQRLADPIAELLQRQPALAGRDVQPLDDRLALRVGDPDLIEAVVGLVRLAVHSQRG